MLNWKIRSSLKLQAHADDLSKIISSYQQTLDSEDIGFFRLPQNSELIEETKKVYSQFKHKKTFIHIGIGGSALGPEMLLSALGNKTDVNFIFLNNIDPDDIEKKIKNTNLHDAVIYIVSKSGTTAETVAAMTIMMNKLHEIGIKENKYKDYFVFCTDPSKGELRVLANNWDIKTLSIPANIGGRFSVLTPCGFLPSFFAGIEVQEILNGAHEIKDFLYHPDKGRDFFELGFWLKHLHDQGINQTVMMPYSSLLKDFSYWFVQLWAESLGKEGKGLTPIPA